MSHGMIEKILLKHNTEGLRDIGPGDIVKTSVDLAIMLDMAGLHPEFTRNPPKKPFDPDRIAMVFDHLVPAPTSEIASKTGNLRKLAEKWGLTKFYDYGRGGISHTLGAELGWFQPGNIIANTDSHTIATGAFNCVGRGLGMPELMQVICTGQTWYILGDSHSVSLEGKLGNGVEAKDVFLSLARDLGEIPNQNIEFSGHGISNLSVDDRSVISTMCAEISAEFALFPFDKILEEYLRTRSISGYSPSIADEGAPYASQRNLNMNELEPMVALPDAVVGNVRPAGDIAGAAIDQATIGSCANGRLKDLESAARILKNRKVHSGVRLIVTPSTQQIYLEAERQGFIRIILEAGGVVTNPTCGSCFGGHMGLLGDGETGITSTTRNFKGRMGSRDAAIYLASSATVAASAVAGHVTDPRVYLEGN